MSFFKIHGELIESLQRDVRDLQHDLAVANMNRESAEAQLESAREVVEQALNVKGEQSVTARVANLQAAEDKLHSIARLLSGEDVDAEQDLLRQMGNRLGMSSPSREKIYSRCDALQKLAVKLDQIKQAMGGIDWEEDVDFSYGEDVEAVERVLGLLR